MPTFKETQRAYRSLRFGHLIELTIRLGHDEGLSSFEKDARDISKRDSPIKIKHNLADYLARKAMTKGRDRDNN